MSVLIPKQAQKHLIKFKNENKKVISRLKSFDTYLNLCNFAEREEKRFLMSHSQEIYRLLQDSFFGFSSKNKSLKTNRSLPKIGDYPLLFRLLAKLVHSFDLMIFLCSIKHRQIVRSQAFPLFLFFIDDLAPLCDERIYPALESIVCFDTFTEEFKDSTIQFRVFPNQMPIRDIPLKEKTPKTNTERLEILQKFLDFILNKTEKKDFWFRTFKKHFLTTLYPSVEKRLNINKTNENNGFQKYCPYEINLKIVKFFISILKNRKFPINIYQNKEYLEYLFEIFKQTLFMPSKYEGIIIQVLTILNKWYSDQKSYFDIQNNMNFFIHSFLNHIILALINPKEDINNKLFETKFNIICDILKTLAIQKESYLGKETWEILLVSVIKITKFYFLNDYFTNVKKIPTSFQKRIINILFHIFIYSKTTKRYHWLLLKKLINQICNNNIVIVQWKRSLSELTLQIHHYIFSLDECVIKNSEYKQLINLEDHEVKLIHRNIKRFSSTKISSKDFTIIPSNSEITKQIKYEKLEKNSGWTKYEAQYFWNQFLNLLKDCHNKLGPTELYLLTSYYLEFYNLLEYLESMIKKTLVYSPLPINEIFVPYFLKTIYLQKQKYKKSISLSAVSLCLLYCKKTNVDVTLDDLHLTNFYLAITYLLSLDDWKTDCCVIRFASKFFEYEFAGSICMINPFLKLISKILHPKNLIKCSNELFYHALYVLNSIISFQDQFSKINIYNITKIFSQKICDLNNFSIVQELMENEICEREQVLEKMYQQKYLNNNQDSINQMIKLENNRRIDKIKNWKENQKDQLINFFMFNKNLIRFELHKILLNILKSQEFSILINNQQTKTIIKNDFLKIGPQNQSNGQQQTESKEQSNQNSGKKVRQWQRRRHQGIFVRKIPIKLLSTSIWSMNLLCIVELLSDSPSLEIISSSIGGIIKQMESNVDEIVIFSRFCLANIFQYYSIIKKKSETLTLDVITQLLTIIYKILKLINPISLTINEKLKKIPINVKEIFKLVITIMRKDSSILFNEKIRNIFFLTFFKIHEYENILNNPKLIQDFKERGLWEINKKSNENIASQGLQVKKTKTARTKSFSGNDLAKNNRRKNKRRTLTKKKLDFNYQKCESKFSNDNEQLNPITFPKWFYQKNDLIKSNLLIQVFNDDDGGGEEGGWDEGEDDDKNKKSQNIPKIQVFIPKKKDTVIPIENITINNFRNVDFFLLNYFRLISNYNLLKSNYELIDSYLDKFDNLPELLINNFKKKTKNNFVDNDDNNSNGLLLLNKKINENNYFHLISFNDSIISLNEISNNFKNRKIRLILRDTTGKFVWDAKYLNNPLQKNDDDDDDENEILNKKKNYSINSLNFDRFIDDNSKLKKKNEQNEKIIIINRKKGDLLNFKNVKNIKKINMLNEMLKYAEEINDPILLESEDKRHKIFENNDLKQLNKIVPNVKKLKIRNINSSMPIKGLSVIQEKKNNKSNVFEGFEIIDKVQDKVNDKDNNAINEKGKEEDQEEFKSLGVQWNETRTKIYNQRKQFSILFNNGLENFKSQKKCNNEKDNVGINMINKESNYNKNISMEKNEHKNKNEIENENKNKNEDIFTINESIKAEMPPPPKPLHFLHYSRLFLSHLGFSSINNFSSINYLKQNEDIKSKISQLDEIPNRKIMKIEVFYIEQLQNYQKIEKNKTRYSKKFLNFFTSLGWKIDISKHYGYLSRILKNKIKIDSITRYYSNLEVEVLFNINFGNNVKEENNENENKNKNEKVVERGEENNSKSCKWDENQEERGKSLECCQYVQIYWLEDENSYDGGLSSSSDYPITIVIFPMKNGMYRFQIVSKNKSIDSVPVFAGPILTSANLVQSIRMIAIYYNYYLFDKENTNKYPTNPHYSRFDQILKIIQNGRDNLKFDQFSKRVFIGNDTEKDDFLLFKQFLNN
ncbi:hypothetical protein M0812_14646 [Anaeramoeba flamelloides]|uniref:Rap-GAP domain-containing protein n=1 Tax=Anaeramoeba flamelloides TaxID=1746091 RepID=A0AAV7ZBX7_9EUKA|nr:hypothetical protein M0812_14646 [Anaeramoeba flamelloides]